MKHCHVIRSRSGLNVYDEPCYEDITMMINLAGVLSAESARGADKCR